MIDLWTTLVPLAIASAILPVQIAITILLLRSSAGRLAAVSWVGGMTVVRLTQGLVFGFVLETGTEAAEATDTPGPIEAALLLVVAIVFFVTAAKKLLHQPDEDDPPPRWMTRVEAVTVGRAFLFGAGMVAISAKLWAFTLGAIGAIVEADLGTPAAVGTFLAFVVAAESIHLAAIALAYLAPERADVVLGRVGDGLQRHGRAIMVALGLVFGTWFLLKALDGFGVV